MDVFRLHDRLIADYASYVKSFIYVRDRRINEHVEKSLGEGLLWPEPLIQLNPSFEPGEWIDDLVKEGTLHSKCSEVFRIKPTQTGSSKPLRLHRHQADAVRAAKTKNSYVLTTGTGSGKSLSYIIPIVDRVLREGSGKGIRAIVVYPMNALANSQFGELQKFLCHGYPDGKPPVTFKKYTGQEPDAEKQEIIGNPPDILLTNYVMLELILTRPQEKALVRSASQLEFLVLDELHTYRGRQGADVAMLIRRVKNATAAPSIQCVGTSATLAAGGTVAQQKVEVARITTRLFGTDVTPENVIGETLRRATPDRNFTEQQEIKELTRRVAIPNRQPPQRYEEFVQDPLSAWIETTFGVTTEPESGRLVRAKPRCLSGPTGAATELSSLTGLPDEQCAVAIQYWLLGGYRCEPNPETGFPVFAFRLHQFISRGDTVYASLQSEEERYITVHGQQFVPGDRDRILLPLVFCRECGQEYYSVRVIQRGPGLLAFESRIDLMDRESSDSSLPGFLYLSTESPWPTDAGEITARVPADWVEEVASGTRVKADRRKYLPVPIYVGANGEQNSSGIQCQLLSSPFRFCLNCGVSYGSRQNSDFPKLASLGSEGRSTATTILTLSAIRNLKREDDLTAKARKLLSFTDNRQDASLQAGHFNDFVEIGLLRSALYDAVVKAGPQGLTHDELNHRVFESLNLPLELYASDPEVRFQAKNETDRALREVLGYRIYRDLEKGWRITAPNLEQCGLLEIRYSALDELCRAEDVWQGRHFALVSASPAIRGKVAKVLLDFMRRGLAIKVDYLRADYQERIQQLSSQRLAAPWALDEDERILEQSCYLFPRSSSPRDTGDHIFLSARGGFGQYLRRPTTFDNNVRLSLIDTQAICNDLLEALRVGGLVEMVIGPREPGDVGGYQVPAAAMTWHDAPGTNPLHDPIRVPTQALGGGRTNEFFVNFYKDMARQTRGFEAREHTAQVPYELRVEREDRFRNAILPILYCSPTMELGVDISELNVVNMRNIPPTPANYAQRSGRAGRSGQPALVFSYCSAGSPHDQYFFRHPNRMVAGGVSTPRLDLGNEDLIRAHVHSIWLAETGAWLGNSLKDILKIEGQSPTLDLVDGTRDSIQSQSAKDRASKRAETVLASIQNELKATDWYSPRWLDDSLNQASRQFDAACERWRSLYRSALLQAESQDKIIRDAARPIQDRRQAERLRAEAEAQLKLLVEVQSAFQSDFYSYRYFASEGFLPGYNFPRLPLSAYISGRRLKRSKDEFLSRPRFLAISEFGPQAIVYHEGSRYVINKVILPVEQHDGEFPTNRVKQCDSCGYLHPILAGDGPDLCERCDATLPLQLKDLFRLQNVSTRRRDRISCDEEERMRYGYEIRTGVRFTERGGQASYRTARVLKQEDTLAKLTYGSAATIWRINLGWVRRSNPDQHGFVLDIERGYWAKNPQAAAEDPDDPMSARTRRVIPFVEDRRNCLIVEPTPQLSTDAMASLAAALKSAIQVEYQLEDNELAVEALPNRDERRLLLFYESAEGGAGVLRQLIDDVDAVSHIAKQALEICHFDPSTGDDRRRAANSSEDCEAACYDCLMSYANQPDHKSLDRQSIRETLLNLAVARVEGSPVIAPRLEHLETLKRKAGSDLEKEWLAFLEQHQYRLPSGGQVLIEACRTRPDFLYQQSQTAIYVDGPHHLYPERQARDKAQLACMEDQGYTVVRFPHQAEWDAIISRYPHIFGKET